MAHLIAEPGSNGAKRGDLATRITKHQMAYARLAKRLRTLRNFGGSSPLNLRIEQMRGSITSFPKGQRPPAARNQTDAEKKRTDAAQEAAILASLSPEELKELNARKKIGKFVITRHRKHRGGTRRRGTRKTRRHR